MKLIPVEPIGTRRSMALVKHASGPCTIEGVELPEYPPSPRGRALRDARVAKAIGVRDLAHVLGISAVQLGELERGRLVTDDAGWDEAMARVKEMSR